MRLIRNLYKRKIDRDVCAQENTKWLDMLCQVLQRSHDRAFFLHRYFRT
jgi:hypothetical protein